MLTRILTAASRVSGRMGRWTITVATLVFAGPLPSLPVADRGRLSYALLLSRKSNVSRRLFSYLMKRDFGKDASIDLEIAEMAMRLGDLSLAKELFQKASVRDKGQAGQVAETMYRYIAQIVDGTAASFIQRQLDALPLIPGGRVAVITLSGHYLDIFELWKEQALKFVDRHFLVIALDERAVRAASQLECCYVLDVSSYFYFDSKEKISPQSRRLLWILRSMILATLVERGHTVFSMDIDAVPLASLDDMIATLPQADIIAQEDFSIPMDVARKHGFILCCGLMIFYPNAATKAFMKRFVERVILELDDQLALNHHLADAGLKNMEILPSYRRFWADGVLIVCPDKQRVSRDIGYGTVVRHFQQRNESIAELRSKLSLP